MGYGKTIRIYLADGVASGIRHAELVNWTGQAMVCPRGRVAELSSWEESHRPGVYLLFGDDLDGPRPLVYIGEAEDVFERLKSHVKNKDFWDFVIFFTSKDENLTKAHVKYLEARLVALAKSIGRAALVNANTPPQPALPRGDRDAMEEFMGPVALLMSALGSSILQPVPQSSQAGLDASDDAGPLSHVRLFFQISDKGVDAEGVSTDEGLVVFAGSVGPAETLDSFSVGLRSLRDDLIASGDIVVEGDSIRFARQVLFTSPSAAAGVIRGGTRNGRKAWRNSAGTSLKELEEALLNGESEPELDA